MRLCLALLLLAAPASVSAQARLRLEMVDCEGAPQGDAALLRQLEIEGALAAPDDPTARLARVEGPCGPQQSVHVVLIDAAAQLRLEQEIALAGIPEHLRTRLVATIATTLLEASSSLARVPAPEPADPSPAELPVLVAPAPVALPSAEPASAAPVVAPPVTAPAPPSAWRMEASAVGRLYLLGGVALLGGARIGASFDRFVIEIAAYGTRGALPTAEVDAGLATLALGLRMVEVDDPSFAFSLAVLLEGGGIWASVRSHVARFVGRDVAAGVGGALGRVRLGIPLPGGLRLEIDVEGGATLGLEIDALAVSVLSVSGPLVALACGLSWS
ncbi:MAG: hypothetical protein U0234_16985 [Sandaracinus sp.]